MLNDGWEICDIPLKYENMWGKTVANRDVEFLKKGDVYIEIALLWCKYIGGVGK